MAKKKRQPQNTSKVTAQSLESLFEASHDLEYRAKILLHDLSNVKDPASERRISATVHELYISTPYFTDEQAKAIREATVKDVKIDPENFDDDGGGVSSSLFPFVPVLHYCHRYRWSES